MSVLPLRRVEFRQTATQLGDWREVLVSLLPAIALIAMLVWAEFLASAALSYQGLNLLLSSAIPLTFAAVSQMFVIVLGDIDLGTGFLVGLVNVVAARWLTNDPLLAIVIFIGIIAAYAAQGALIHLRRIPSIIVTLGSSFIWSGLGLLVLAVPGGTAPHWLTDFFAWTPPIFPLPIWLAIVLAAVVYVITHLTPYGTVIRGAGSNSAAVVGSGWSMLKIKMSCYALAAFFGILSGLAVTGITASGDSTASANYTLLAIAAVILGGAKFSGGRSVPIGAVVGALALGIVGPVLGLANVSSNYQTGAQGLILLIVLAGRVLTRRAH
ncbi:MAG: ABC transporter permease [Solirubrobacterales bacterium]|nr:ABC transporter permease [Solirubrobacterales bacterium]